MAGKPFRRRDAGTLALSLITIGALASALLPTAARAQEIPPDRPRIVLPSGYVLDVEALFLDTIRRNDFASLFPPKQDVFSLEFNSGKPWATAAHQQGKLHGATIALYETGELATVAGYLDAERHGNVLTWSATGEKSLFAQYQKGRLHGLLCRFKNDSLWLVQEYRSGQLESSHLVENDEIIKSHIPAHDGKTIKDKELAAAHKDLEQALKGLAEKEIEFKKTVMNLEQQRRRLAAAGKAVQKRERINRREGERSDAIDRAIGELRKHMLLTP